MKAIPSFLLKQQFNCRSDQKDEACLWGANEKPENNFLSLSLSVVIKTSPVTFNLSVMNTQVEWNDVV